MKLFFAGNFPQMKSIKSEKKMRDFILSKGEDYRRLLSFYYEDDILKIIEMRREEDRKR